MTLEEEEILQIYNILLLVKNQAEVIKITGKFFTILHEHSEYTPETSLPNHKN